MGKHLEMDGCERLSFHATAGDKYLRSELKESAVYHLKSFISYYIITYYCINVLIQYWNVYITFTQVVY